MAPFYLEFFRYKNKLKRLDEMRTTFLNRFIFVEDWYKFSLAVSTDWVGLAGQLGLE